MITASEPLEYIPRGRRTVYYHPGPIAKDKPKPSLPTETILLERLKSMSLTGEIEGPPELYKLREVLIEDAASGSKGNQLMPYASTEEELYAYGHTAVWTRSLKNERFGLPHTTFSFHRPIKLAFFCPRRFLEPSTLPPGKCLNRNGICLVDDETLEVYCDNGETYGAKLDCEVSAIWPTPFGILLQKDADRSQLLNSIYIPMPRLFTLSYPTDEMKPVLLKAGSTMAYLTEPYYHVVFTSEQLELVLLYNERFRKHFICWLRPATDEEKMCPQIADSDVESDREDNESEWYTTPIPMKLQPDPAHDEVDLNAVKEELRATLGSSVMDNTNQKSPSGSLTTDSKSFLDSIGAFCNWKLPFEDEPHVFDTRKFGCSASSAPIVAEYCLQRVWEYQVPHPGGLFAGTAKRTSETPWSDLVSSEMASVGFLHEDLVGTRYVCYLQLTAHRLTLVQYEHKSGPPDIILVHSIQAIAAVSLDRLNLIVVYDPTGKLMLYSGPQPVGKVHVPGLLSTCFLSSTGSLFTSTNAGASAGPASWKRSSLLPNIATSDIKFGEDVHMLSPVRPIGGSVGDSVPELNLSLMDGTGTRFTIALDGGVLQPKYHGRSFRVALPPLAESQIVRRCLVGLQHVLPPETAHAFLIRWYGTRNVPGSHAGFSIRQEWKLFQALLFTAMGRPNVSLDPTVKGNQERSTPLGSTTADRRSSAVDGGGTDHFGLGASCFADEPKKRRCGENTHGTDCDWEFLLCKVSPGTASNAPPKATDAAASTEFCRTYKTRGPQSLYQYIPEILRTLHLLYEDFKLDSGLADELRLLGEFLYCLATDGMFRHYQQHYFLDFPELCDQYPVRCSSIIDKSLLKKLNDHSTLPPSIFRYMHSIVRREPQSSGLQREATSEDFVPYPYLFGINELSRDMMVLVALIFRERRLTKWVNAQLSANLCPEKLARQLAKPLVLKAGAGDPSRNETLGNMLLHFLIEQGYTRDRLDDLPLALRFVVLQALEPFREYTMHGHDEAVYELLFRPELHEHALSARRTPSDTGPPERHPALPNPERYVYYVEWMVEMGEYEALTGVLCAKEDQQRAERDDGMDSLDMNVLKLRFPYDRRIDDVRSFLTSSKRVIIDIPQAPNVSDHDFIEDQERRLYSFCLRTMAQPVGRGMFTLSTSHPPETQVAPIPRLCLTGRDLLRGATIEVLQLEVPPHMNLWPSFHNGVAAGLRICPDSPQITSGWIVNNRNARERKGGPPNNGCPFGPGTEATIEHGGLLLALGLIGHLRQLSLYDIFDYMVRSNEMVRVGLLLGLAVAHRGTEHFRTTCLLAVHVEALLPPTAVELDVPQNLQVAALFGIGLVYQCTAKRHVTEILLQEIGRPPGPEMDNSLERESYALAAGLALGLVTLGRGDQLTGLCDLAIPGELYHYMNGGTRRSTVGAQREKYKLSSFQIREGDDVNLDVTAPSATLALGLMYFGTGDQTVTGWMLPPDTKYLFGYVRPDLLLLRIVAGHLIGWDKILPTQAWVKQHLPAILIETVENVENNRPDKPSMLPSLECTMTRMERELYCQAYCAIVCGSAVAIGLRFAGTADFVAAETIYHYLRYFIAMRHLPKKKPTKEPEEEADSKRTGMRVLAKLIGGQVLENCVLMTLLAFSLVMVGTGDLRGLRTVRMLRSRIGIHGVTYGSHLAINMALGFLFLGAGRYTLSRSPSSIAALVCAIFPKFPMYSNDNRYHLQALRHLYVLAVEPRLFVPRRVDTGQLTVCRIRYAVRIPSGPDGLSTERVETQMAPWMLPELHTLTWVEVCDENFNIVRFDQHNWTLLENILHKRGYIDVLQHVGCLSYLDDPTRVITMRMQNLPGKDYSPWEFLSEQLLELESHPGVVELAQRLLIPPTIIQLRAAIEPTNGSRVAKRAVYYFKHVLANCVMKDRLHVMSIVLDLTEMLLQPEYKVRMPTDAWQLLLLRTTLGRRIAMLKGSGQLLPGRLLPALVMRTFGDWTAELHRYHSVLQDLCGIFNPENAQLYDRLSVLRLAPDEGGIENVASTEVRLVESGSDSTDPDHRLHILVQAARIAMMQELTLSIITPVQLSSLCRMERPTRVDFATTLSYTQPGLSPSTCICLTDILNLT